MTLNDGDWKNSIPEVEAHLLAGGHLLLKNKATNWGFDLSVRKNSYVLEMRGFTHFSEEQLSHEVVAKEMTKLRAAVRDFVQHLSEYNGLFAEMGQEIGVFSDYGMGAVKLCRLSSAEVIEWTHPWYMEGGKFNAAT